MGIFNFSEYLKKESEHNTLKISTYEQTNNITIEDERGYSVKVICDSSSPLGSRLTTITARYPRFVHSELMTHREFSRNAASSRAIPVSKIIAQVESLPAMPYKWQKNQKGMQGGEELTGYDLKNAKQQWIVASQEAIHRSEQLQSYSCHKQICNRLLEPFVWMTTVISSTNWSNFFALRCSDQADPTIRHIAELIQFCIENNKPNKLEYGEWHLPFIVEPHKNQISENILKMHSVARCARVSYLNHEGKIDGEKDLELYEKLVSSGHWSPLEHVALPEHKLNLDTNEQGGNFGKYWVQFRKQFANEYIK